MSDAAKKFIESWKDHNIHAEGYEPEDDNSEARQRAQECRLAGFEEGFTAADLDAAAADMIGGGDDLIDLMANAIEEANDAEAARQSEI